MRMRTRARTSPKTSPISYTAEQANREAQKKKRNKNTICIHNIGTGLVVVHTNDGERIPHQCTNTLKGTNKSCYAWMNKAQANTNKTFGIQISVFGLLSI